LNKVKDGENENTLRKAFQTNGSNQQRVPRQSQGGAGLGYSIATPGTIGN